MISSYWGYFAIEITEIALTKAEYTGQQHFLVFFFFFFFFFLFCLSRTNLMRWITKSHCFCSIMFFFTFSFTCTNVWSILEEVGGGKMPFRIIVLIGNHYFNDKKYSGPIVMGDYVEKGLVWSHKTSKSYKNWCSALHVGVAFAGGIDALQRKERHQRPSGGHTEYSSHRCTLSSA